MASWNKFQPFVETLAEKTHNLGSDTLKVALTNTAPTAGLATLSQITEISYTYCSSRTLTVSSSAQSSGTYKLVVNDLTLTASGGSIGPFQYVVVYNDTAASDDLIGWWDYGSALTLTDGGSLLIDLSPTNGMLQIA
jgi:hypothetical protein